MKSYQYISMKGVLCDILVLMTSKDKSNNTINMKQANDVKVITFINFHMTGLKNDWN